MKKIIVVVTMIFGLLLSACSHQVSSKKSDPESISSIKISSDESSSDIAANGSRSQEDNEISVIENISLEDQQEFFRKYIEPYYIVGLLYDTWSSPEEIEVDRLINFYKYNAYEDYCYALQKEHSDTTHTLIGAPVPADILESYLMNYFEVSSIYLRSADNYDASSNCYLFPDEFGIGGGAGVNIERVEKSGDTLKFICRDMVDTECSVTVKIVDKDKFFYVAGN